MNQPQPSTDQLRTVLSQTLSTDSDVRKNAEQQLVQAQKIAGHPLQVLRIIASSDAADVAVRQAAAVHFKNIVKKGWDANNEDETNGIVISPADRDLIKSHLVELMCTVPHQIQAQCSESISIIAAADFPEKWNNLLPGLVQKFRSPDQSVVNGVLLTANSILKPFRYVQRSDALYRDILYVLERLQAPLLTLFKTTGTAVAAYGDYPDQLRPRLAALRSICRIFYSLNWQDLPEYFEDHMSEWMEEFAKYLSYENTVLTDPNEETESSPIDNLQAAIVDNLTLYANKDEEPFLPFLPQFTTLVWKLLLRVTTFPKHDTLATKSINFLSSLVGKQMHRGLFQDIETLKQIISLIVIPNLMLREVDEERFEDDPQEFILSDIEGSDTESRRKCTQDLLRAMCRQFEAEVTAICSEHIASMLAEFDRDSLNKWAAKDAAIHLMLGISVRAESSLQGVSAVNENVHIMNFFGANILTELQEANQLVRPMVKATAIKFVCIFRNQFSKDDMAALMPLLISQFTSPSIVVHTYAAACIEKMLTSKVEGLGGVKQLKFGRQELKPFLEPLFSGLFSIVDKTEVNENEYVMKCVMRSLSVAKDDIIQVTQIVLEKLTTTLGTVAKNPRNPNFNHYLFESIAVLVQSVCSKNPGHTSAFEGLLFPPFQTVLQMDVLELTPYVFQILAQLLEYRPVDSGLGQAYSVLFAPLLSPGLWERKGNIPALTRLLQAYLMKGPMEIVSQGHLIGILGVFQKLISSKVTDSNGFDILRAITQFVAHQSVQPYLKNVFQILLMRLQQGKTPRYVRLITDFFALYMGKQGAQAYLDQMNAIQPGLGLMLIVQIWIPRLQADLPFRMEAKVQIVALTKILCDIPALLEDADGQQIWTKTLACALNIATSPLASFEDPTDDGDFEVEIGYDATYSKLHFASRSQPDPFPNVKEPRLELVKSLHALCSSQPGRIRPLIQHGLQSEDAKLYAGLETLCTKAGLSMI